jgi:hypothetical protein
MAAMVVAAAFALLSPFAVVAVQAQTLFAGVGYARLWDDETFLGGGIAVSAGASYPLARHIEIEGEVAWARHFRDVGYLTSEGTPLAGVARVAYLFQRQESRARVFGSAGLGVIHSAGTFTLPSFLVTGDGGLVEGPSTEADWSLTKPSFEVGVGVIVAGNRLGIRPEVRWTSTIGASSPSSGIEAPIWMIRAGVAVTWRLSREHK